MNPPSCSVAAVVVTYRRQHLLRECLQALLGQTRAPDEIIVVDNASADGTPDLVKMEFPEATLMALTENIGGAGGFHCGIKTAHKKGYDWVWCMDDDTAPTPGALTALMQCADEKREEPLGFLASRVVWTDGSLHRMNQPNLFWDKNRPRPVEVEKLIEGIHEVDTTSFVGCLFSRQAIESVGYPNPDFFVWFDDVEYTSRMKDFANYHVAASVVVHKTKVNEGSVLFPRSKDEILKCYYGLRNIFYSYREDNRSLLARYVTWYLREAVSRVLSRQFSGAALYWSLLAMYRGYTGRLVKCEWRGGNL